ncbi:MAG TPA: dihydroorotate dehydrogenase electron transfer subunit, partial [Coriobacteriia bacterium]|nr:dihydroorotate dehydrogenase electron transfer subunit [Coriobacteriia bacterium]
RIEVVANTQVAPGVGLVVFHAPRTAASARPGQFVHVRVSEDSLSILRRPFAIHRVRGERIEVLYQVVGVGTRQLAEATPGTRMDLLGPLGNGWRIDPEVRHALLVAGGLGVAPLGMLAEVLAARGVAVTVALGAASEERVVGRDVFEAVARRVEVATDDGSCGAAGPVTGVCERLLADEALDVVYTCGPEAMQRIVAGQVAAAGIPCQVSLERLMACGIGTCLSCVAETAEGLKRVCVDGPVFDATAVRWESAPGEAVAAAKSPLGGSRV